MARTYLTPIDMGGLEIWNAVVQNLAAAPTSPAPKKGQMYFDTTNNTLFWYDGSGWVSAVGGAGAFPGYGASTAVTTFGAAKADGSGTTVARSDHTHGSPTHDNAAHSAITLASLSSPFGASTAVTTFGASKSDGAGTTAARNDHTHGSPTHDAAAHSTIPISALAVPTVDVPWNAKKITGLADGTAATDAVNKQQLDTAVQGLDAKQSVRLASTANLGLTGLAAIDGVTPIAGDRILAKNQTTTSQNGIYVAAAGAWTRATDMDTWAEVPDAFTWVEQGSLNADTGWVCTTVAGGVINTNPITWTQFSGAGQISAGAGMTKTGSQLDVGAGQGIVVNADDVAVSYGGSSGDFGVGNGVARSDHAHSGYAVASRTITTTAPLRIDGGASGDLSASRTLSINNFNTTTAGTVASPGSPSGRFLKDDGSWATPSGARVYSIGNAAATSTVVNHAFGTRDVDVAVYRNSTPWDTVETDMERTDTANVTVRFAVAPAANAFRIVVTG